MHMLSTATCGAKPIMPPFLVVALLPLLKVSPNQTLTSQTISKLTKK